MAAGQRRRGNATSPNAVVQLLNFQHLLCAVKVVLHNNSERTGITLNQMHFKGLIVSDDVRLTLTPVDNPLAAGYPASFSFNWIDPERNTTSPLFSASLGLTGQLISHGGSYTIPEPVSETEQYILLPPQDLAPLSANPRLEINYSYYDSGQAKTVTPPTKALPLKTILNESDDSPITSWQAGRIYVYHIYLRVDGGVEVRVVTTKWETVNAQTPGIML